jgi:hypothetical protein
MNAQRVQPFPKSGTVGFTAISELPQCALKRLSRLFNGESRTELHFGNLALKLMEQASVLEK